MREKGVPVGHSLGSTVKKRANRPLLRDSEAEEMCKDNKGSRDGEVRGVAEVKEGEKREDKKTNWSS